MFLSGKNVDSSRRVAIAQNKILYNLKKKMYTSDKERLINEGGGKQTNANLLLFSIFAVILVLAGAGIGALYYNKYKCGRFCFFF